MSELTIRGTLEKVLNPESGVSKAGKEWNRQEFVIKTDDPKYPKDVCFTLFGDKTSLLDSINIGSVVDISFNVESREYNEKWFHNLNAWKIDEIKTANEIVHENGYAKDKRDVSNIPNPEDDPNNDLPW